MKKLCVFLFVVLLLAAAALPVSAGKLTVLIDNGAFFDDRSAATVRYASACNCHFGDITPYLITSAETANAPSAEKILQLCGIDWDTDAIVLFVRTYQGEYYYDMYTFGKATDAFTDEDINTVLDTPDVYNNIKGGRVKLGYKAFYRACHSYVSRYEEEQRLLKEEREKRAPYVALAVGAGSGAVVAGITVLCVFLAYRKKQHGESYPLDRYAKLNLTQANDIFVGSHVTRVRVNTNSSSGGRSGGGGGGGHRGGR